MEIISKIFLENKAWAADITNKDKDYFLKLAQLQEPDFLWIGCSDSRVPANEITNTEPGELFVHRNIANVVDINDINLMSVIQYAVQYLKVKHIVVCGHYGCGGIKAAMTHESFGNMDIWLSKIKKIYLDNAKTVDAIPNEEERLRKMVELNVLSGTSKIKQIDYVKEIPEIQVHGWVYDLRDGILHKVKEGPQEASLH